MSTRKQREIIRQRRLEFDRRVEENRKNMEAFVEKIKEPEKKKRGRPKKVKEDDVSGTDK